MVIKTIPIPNSGFNQTVYEMTASEVKIILPLIKREYSHAVKMAEHYEDLVMDGYGTDRQTTALTKWQNKAEKLANIIKDID